MKQTPNPNANPRRGRGRSNGKRNPNQSSRSRNYDHAGSDNKVRGSSQQILDKYLALARDASLSGDRIAAEGFQQYAEHYYRVLNPEQGPEVNQGGNQHERKPRRDNNRNQQPDTPVNSDHHAKNQTQMNEPAPAPVVEAAQAPVPAPVIEEPAPAAAVEITIPAPAVEAAEAPAAEPVVEKEEVVEPKPRRRGRPRKVVAAEPAA